MQMYYIRKISDEDRQKGLKHVREEHTSIDVKNLLELGLNLWKLLGDQFNRRIF